MNLGSCSPFRPICDCSRGNGSFEKVGVGEMLALPEENDGLVTASQARAIGFVDSVLARMTRRGRLERVATRRLSNPLLPLRSVIAIPGGDLVEGRESWTPRMSRSLMKPHRRALSGFVWCEAGSRLCGADRPAFDMKERARTTSR